MALLLGIAGRTGAGKNLVASLLEKKGWRTLDLDVVAHQVLNSAADLVHAEFGPGLVDDQGMVDRRVLGAKVFDQPHLLRKLESITYPLIEEKAKAWIAEGLGIPAAIHAVNLHKTAYLKRFDAIIWVHAPRFIRRKRVMAREGRPWSELKGRFKSQKGLNPKLFSSHAETYRVRNSGNPKRLERRLEEILRRLEG